MTIIWCIISEIWSVTNKIFRHFGLFFAFLPPNNQKNQNFEKLKKKPPGNVTIWHMCTKNHDHMPYCSLDMGCNRFNYFLFWAIFCPFTSLTAQQIKIFKKIWKNAWRYHHFTMVYQKPWSYALPFLRYGV